MPRPFLPLCLLPLAVVISSCPRAEDDPRYIPGYPLNVRAFDAREMAMLPGYCKHTQTFRDRVPGGKDRKEMQRWYALQGPTFHAMHHYCLGLMHTHRALLLATNARQRNLYLRASIPEFDYVLERAPHDFVLLPEILTKKGENLILAGNGPAGALALLRAIESKPDYWPPYATLSDYYKETGDVKAARVWLDKGLSIAPNVGALKRRLIELERDKRR